MELPNYRFPSAINVYRLIYTRSKDFITRAFTIIFVSTIIGLFSIGLDVILFKKIGTKKIEIPYDSDSDLERILEIIGISLEGE